MTDKHGYSPPASELPGVKTLVHPDSVTEDHTKGQALPSPPWSRSKPAPQVNFGKPSPGKPDDYKVPNKPGEDSPVPDPAPSTVVKRRPEVNAEMDVCAAVHGPAYPPMGDRQKVQRGQARMYYKQYYRGNRGKIKRRMNVWYKKWKNRFNYQKDQERRREHPDKFERKPGGGVKENKDRAQQYRDKTAEMMYFDGAELFHLETEHYGTLLGVDPDTCEVLIFMNNRATTFPLRALLEDFVFLSEDDIERAMADLDAAFDYWQEEQSERLACRYSEMLYEKRPPEMDPDTHWDRGKPRPIKDHKHQPANGTPDGSGTPDYYVYDNPGSAKVIPENRDFVNNRAAMMKVAVKLADIQQGCSDELLAKSRQVKVRLVRVDDRNMMWLFNAKGSKGKVYRIRVKVVPKGNVRDVNKADILVSCTCPFWQWQGPEYHAQSEGYLYGEPRGTATSPDIKDPTGRHKACKHILAVLDKVANFVMPGSKPASPDKAKKVASLQYLADNFAHGRVVVVPERELELESFVQRYGLRQKAKGGAHADL